MFQFATNQFLFKLVMLAAVLTCGCATISKHTVSKQPAIAHEVDADIPRQAVAAEDVVRSKLPTISVNESVALLKSERPRVSKPAAPMPLSIDTVAQSSPVDSLAATTPKTTATPVDPKKLPPVALPIDQQDCLPELEQWKAEFAKKSELTDKKLNKLQTALNDSLEKMERMERKQADSKTEIDRLKNQVDFYRREVTRLEQMMETQHIADLVILDSLTSQLGSLLQRTKSRQTP